MKKTARFLGIFTALSLLLASLAACGGSNGGAESAADTGAEPTAQAEQQTGDSGGEEVVIRFVNWGSAEESTSAAFEEMIRMYEEQNPGVTIESVSLPYNQVLEQLLIMSSGGTPPDCAQIHGSMVSTLVASGALTPLDDLVAGEVWEDFYESTMESAMYDGKKMITPWVPSPDVLYYNKTLLAAAGYDAPPTTVEEMYQMAEDVAALGTNDEGNKVYGLSIASKKLPGTGYCFIPYIWAEGVNVNDEDGTVTLDTEEAIEAFRKVQYFMDNDVTPKGLELNELRNLFAQGQIAFFFDGDYGFIQFAQASPKGDAFLEEIDAAVPPTGVDGRAIAPVYEHNLGVFEGSENKEVAADFISFLSGPEAIQAYNELSGTKTPSRHSVGALPWYSAEENAQFGVFLDTVEVSRPFPQKNPGFIKAMEEIAVALQRVGINGEDPATVCADLNQTVTELYSEA